MDLKIWASKLIQGQELPLNVAKEKASLGEMYLGDALKAHINWREKWLTALREGKGGEYTAADVSAENLCQVGQWLFSEGQKYASLPEYEQFIAMRLTIDII